MIQHVVRLSTPLGALRTSSIDALRKPLPRQNQVGQGEELVKLCSVIGESPVANVSIFEEIFKDMKGMLHSDPDLSLDLFKDLEVLL